MAHDDGTRPDGWHALEVEEVLSSHETTADGLTSVEARRRLEQDGPNALVITPPRPAWAILVDQVRSLIVALLAAAGAVSLVMGDVADAVAIAAVLVVNVALGFVTELRARRTMESLRSLEVQQAVALRDGVSARIDARGLVRGDVVELEAGLAVPADLRLLRASELQANEAPLTGEPFPVSKSPDAVGDDAGIAQRTSMLHKGTLVTSGAGSGVVVATGMSTQVGRISELVQRTDDETTPLERRLDHLGRRLVVLALAVAALVAGLGWLRGGEGWLMLETGIALAVAAVPEGLPVVATITLAVGMARMARRRALIRSLPSVEALGSVTVVCTDKTGTLTAGEMTVTRLTSCDDELIVTGVGYGPEGRLERHAEASDGASRGHDTDALAAEGSVWHRLLRVAALCNRAAVSEHDGSWAAQGDPTEAALLVAAGKGGVDREALLDGLPEVGEVPFSSERMVMATFHGRPDGGLLACVKGAPERIIERCSRVATADGERPLDEATRTALLDRNAGLAAGGLRVLAFAEGVLPAPAEADAPGEDQLAGLEFLGLAGFADPPAEGVAETIAGFRSAGIRTVMITGDQPRTAEAVARELGVLVGDEVVVDGSRLAGMDDAEFAALARDAAVFSRTAPADKLRIVQALRAGGAVVGMLGDGVNDAAALKGADVGVAMGRRGTDVAKETADVVLADDRLQTVLAAVEGGRVIDANIRKFIDYLFSCNLSEVLVLLAAGIVGLPMPLMPLQILWLNLLTDVFPALALAMEPAERDVMRRPPVDPSAAIMSRRFTLGVVGHASALTAVVLSAFVWALDRGDARLAVTVAFVTLALAQLFHAFNARSLRPVLWGWGVPANPWLYGATALCLALTGAALYVPPLAGVLGHVPLAAADLLVCAAAAAVPLVLGQLARVLMTRPVSAVAGPSSAGHDV